MKNWLSWALFSLSCVGGVSFISFNVSFGGESAEADGEASGAPHGNADAGPSVTPAAGSTSPSASSSPPFATGGLAPAGQVRAVAATSQPLAVPAGPALAPTVPRALRCDPLGSKPCELVPALIDTSSGRVFHFSPGEVKVEVAPPAEAAGSAESVPAKIVSSYLEITYPITLNDGVCVGSRSSSARPDREPRSALSLINSLLSDLNDDICGCVAGQASLRKPRLDLNFTYILATDVKPSYLAIDNAESIANWRQVQACVGNILSGVHWPEVNGKVSVDVPFKGYGQAL